MDIATLFLYEIFYYNNNMEEMSFDYIIIGAGAAGLASAQYAARGGLKTVVLDAAGAGGQLMQITDLENYPGIFPSVNGADLISKMEEQAKAFGASLVQANVNSIDKLNDKFVVKTNNAIYKASALCLATGAIHSKLNIPGEEALAGRGVSYCAVCDGPFFRNKRIIVIGGGDSACSEAIYLSTLSKDVTIIHRRDAFRAQKGVVDKMLNAGVKTLMDCVVTEIKGNQMVQSILVKNVKTQETSEVECDGVFIFAGMMPQTDLVEMLPKDEGGYIKTDENMQTVVPGLYAAGDVRSKSFRQIVTAVSDGAIAAHSAAKFLGK